MAEVRAGLRRYAGTDRGEAYQGVGTLHGEGEFSTPGATERTVGDYLDPSRPGTATSVVNAVTRDCGADASAWRWLRLLDAVAQMEAEADARERQRQGAGP